MYMHISLWAIEKIKNTDSSPHGLACGGRFPNSDEDPSTVIQSRDIHETTKEIKMKLENEKPLSWSRLENKVTCPDCIKALKKEGL